MMPRIAVAVLTVAFIVAWCAGCAPIPEQKLGDGQVGCMTITGVYGSASSVVMRADNVPKGATATGKTRITCGSAVMEIDSSVGVPGK